LAKSCKTARNWLSNYSCSAGWKFNKGRATRISRPFVFPIFMQIFIMIFIWKWLIILCECFNTCLLKFRHDFSWLSVTKQSRFIIAYYAESVGQNQQISAKACKILFLYALLSERSARNAYQNAKEVDCVPVKRRQCF